jgi:hypothetical protein
MDDLLRDAIANLQSCFSGPENTQTIIPIEDNQYKITSVQGNTGRFKATIKTNFHNEEDIAMFIQNYGIKNNETLRVTKARKASGNGEYTLIKYFRCHHHTRYEATMCPAQILASQPSKRFKNTNCPFSLVVRLGLSMRRTINEESDCLRKKNLRRRSHGGSRLPRCPNNGGGGAAGCPALFI